MFYCVNVIMCIETNGQTNVFEWMPMWQLMQKWCVMCHVSYGMTLNSTSLLLIKNKSHLIYLLIIDGHITYVESQCNFFTWMHIFKKNDVLMNLNVLYAQCNSIHKTNCVDICYAFRGVFFIFWIIQFQEI
jgi:hypothetical protein